MSTSKGHELIHPKRDIGKKQLLAGATIITTQVYTHTKLLHTLYVILKAV